MDGMQNRLPKVAKNVGPTANTRSSGPLVSALLLTGFHQLALALLQFRPPLLDLWVIGLLHLLGNATDQFLGALILGRRLDLVDYACGRKVVLSLCGHP